MVFSMESMLAALGKQPERTDAVQTYVQYIKNQQEMRFERFAGDELYSEHSFYLPVKVVSAGGWEKRFEESAAWTRYGDNCYCMEAGNHLVGRYVIKAGKEEFILKFRELSLQRYLKNYAVLKLKVDNYCYPGNYDRSRINSLAAPQFIGAEAEATDGVELKIKFEKDTYSAITKRWDEQSGGTWLQDLLEIGSRRPAPELMPLCERMYCVESTEEEDLLIQMILQKDGILREIERELAEILTNVRTGEPLERLGYRQKRSIKSLYEFYRYMRVAFIAEFESDATEEQKKLLLATEANLGTPELTERLQKKFDLFF